MAENIGKKILIIENNPVYVEIMENALFQTGYQTRIADTASEGLRLANSDSPQLIILNYALQDLSGKDLIVALRSNGYENPILIISDEIDSADVIQVIRLGASDFIIPPFRDTEIMSIVDRVLIQADHLEVQEKRTKQTNQTITNLKKRINQLSIVHALQKTFNSLSNENKIIEFMYRAISHYFETSSSYHISINEKQALILKHGLGLESLPNAKINQEWKDELGVYLAFSKTPTIISKQELKKYNLDKIGKTAIGYPLVINEQVKSIFVFIRKNGDSFKPGDMKFIDLIAEQAIESIKCKQNLKKIKQRNQDIKYLEKRLQLIIQENNKTNQKFTKEIGPNIAQNQILLFELKSNPHIKQNAVDTMIENLLEIEKNIKLCKLNLEYLNTLSLQEICLNNLLDDIITPLSPNEAVFHYEGENNLYISDKDEIIEKLLKELLKISLSHRTHKPILIKLEETQSKFAKISFINHNQIIDYETMLMLFDSLYEKEVLPLPTEQEIEERKKTSTLKQIIYMEQGILWAEKTSPHGNAINFTIPLSVDSFSK